MLRKIVCTVFFTFLIGAATVPLFALETNYLFFQAAYDQNDTLLGTRTASSDPYHPDFYNRNPLTFTTSQSVTEIRFQARLLCFGGHTAPFTFTGTTIAHAQEGVPAGYAQTYSDSMVSAGELNGLLPIAPMTVYDFWVYTATVSDPTMLNAGNTYFLYQWEGNPSGSHLSYRVGDVESRINFRNDVQWTVTPEPGTIALFGMGVPGLFLFRRRRNRA